MLHLLTLRSAACNMQQQQLLAKEMVRLSWHLCSNLLIGTFTGDGTGLRPWLQPTAHRLSRPRLQ